MAKFFFLISACFICLQAAMINGICNCLFGMARRNACLYVSRLEMNRPAILEDSGQRRCNRQDMKTEKGRAVTFTGALEENPDIRGPLGFKFVFEKSASYVNIAKSRLMLNNSRLLSPSNKNPLFSTKHPFSTQGPSDQHPDFAFLHRVSRREILSWHDFPHDEWNILNAKLNTLNRTITTCSDLFVLYYRFRLQVFFDGVKHGINMVMDFYGTEAWQFLNIEAIVEMHMMFLENVLQNLEFFGKLEKGNGESIEFLNWTLARRDEELRILKMQMEKIIEIIDGMD